MGKTSKILICLLFLSAVSCAPPHPERRVGSDWPVYRGSHQANQYSPLDQINHRNVDQLQVAWTFKTGDAGGNTSIQCNPIIIGDWLYATSPGGRCIALNAATGEERWSFDPRSLGELEVVQSGVNRGVAFWKGETEARIFHSAGYRLFALDALSGSPREDFGKGGYIDLRENLGKPKESVAIGMTSPGVVFEDLLIIGSSLTESYGASPGHIRAYDVRSGELAWIFHTIPQAGDPAHQTWSWTESFDYGGANAWGGLSLDTLRGWVFAGTGSPTYDFYGAGRQGKNLYGNCVLALDARTGSLQWHYQVVRHDLWDYDLPCAPNLVTLELGGERVDAVAQITKMGHVFVLDRQTGEPLFPVRERRVPASDLPGESAWPTQPIPQKPPPFTRQGISRHDLNDLHPEWAAEAREAFRAMRGGPLFTPPSQAGTIMMPGTRGGGEWGGAAFDPASGTLFVNANEYPSIVEMQPMLGLEEERQDGLALGAQLYQQHCTSCHGLNLRGDPPAIPTLHGLIDRYENPEAVGLLIRQGSGAMPAFTQLDEGEVEALQQFLFTAEPESLYGRLAPSEAGYFVVRGYRRFLLKNGFPAIKPPWGTLNAIDLEAGEIRWQVPLGAFQELLDRGIPPTGTQNLGGPLLTASGLVFIGASMDEKFRAFDSASGDILWETKLPAGGYATPATYAVKGKQYIVIAAGGGGKLGTPSGDSYVAFSLPE